MNQNTLYFLQISGIDKPLTNQCQEETCSSFQTKAYQGHQDGFNKGLSWCRYRL